MITLPHLFRGSSRPVSQLVILSKPTIPHPLPFSPKPAMEFSVPHLLACRANYLHSVVPAFPATKAFAPHFCDSYALMKSMSKESSEALPASFGLLLLGVRAHAVLPASFSKLLGRHEDQLGQLGLKSHTMQSGAVEVFHSKNILPSLESILGGSLMDDRAVMSGLNIFANYNHEEPSKYPYALLGWPSLATPKDVFSIHQIPTYSGTMNFLSKQGESLTAGPLVAAAVAVVAQIMGKLEVLPQGLFYTESIVASLMRDVPA